MGRYIVQMWKKQERDRSLKLRKMMVLPYNTFTQGIDSRSYASEEME